MQQWHKHEYAECLKSLKEISVDDSTYKVDHNTALARYKNGEFDRVDLIKTLQALSVEGVSEKRFQPEACFAMYNLAVIHVEERQLRTALTLLEDLFQYIDAIDETIALCICFLLLDVYIMIGAADGWLHEKAQSVVDYLEKPHMFNDGNSTMSSNQQCNVKSRLTAYKTKLALLQGLGPIPPLENDIKDDASIFGVTSEKPLTGISECLNANILHQSGNEFESLSLLEEARKKGLPNMYYLNNVGCIHYFSGRYSCAAVYFARALQSDERREEVLCNLGVQLLRNELPVLAYDCFFKVAGINYNRPRVWIHIAECVAMSHSAEGGLRTMDSVSGQGSARKIHLNAKSLPQKKKNATRLPLDMGLRATVNVLYIVSKDLLNSNSSDESDILHLRTLKYTALLLRAYLALCQENWSLAYNTSEELIKNLTQSKIPKVNSMLVVAHTYCAESRIRLGLSGDTMDHLRKALDFEIEELKLTKNQSSVQMKSTLCVNMALVKLIAGDLVEPENLLHKAIEFLPSSLHAMRALIYLYLRRGDIDRAKRILKTT